MMNRLIPLYLLFVLHLFLGISGIAGGGLLLLNPDGSLLGMNTDWLVHSPFETYLIPGFLLFTFVGLFPLFTVVGLLLKPNWPWANALNIYADRHWGWTYSLYSGIILIAWIAIQLTMTPYFWLQPVMIFTGLLIIVLTLAPSVMRHFNIAPSG